MMIRARSYLVPLTLVAMAFVSCTLTGCGRDASSPGGEPPAHTPESYMNDPDFRGKLKDQRVAREELRKAREIVVAQMKAKIDAVTQKLGTNDTAAIRAALRADPEWQSLYKRCQDANTALAESRRKTQSFVSQRLNPSAEVPAEKPAAGKGPAKSILK